MPAPTRTLRRDLTLQLGPALGLTVSMYSAVRDTDASLHGVCCGPDTTPHAPSRIKQKAYCPVCDISHPAHQAFPRGKEKGDGIVLIPAAVLDQANAGGEKYKRTIDISVHDATELAAAMPTGKSYYLTTSQPDAYLTLIGVMRARPDLAFVGRFAFDKAAYFYRLVAAVGTGSASASEGRGSTSTAGAEGTGALILRQLAFPDAVVDAPAVTGTADPKAVELLASFVERVRVPFKPEEVTNDRARIIQEYVDSQEAVTAATPTDTSAPTQSAPLDFTAKLQAALRAVEPAPKRARKTAAVKVAPAKKVTPTRKARVTQISQAG
jgi:hypothetical protein